MVQDQGFNFIRNISLIILAVLAVLCAAIYFLLPLDISLAVIISSFLAFIVFGATIFYYRWIIHKKVLNAAKSIMISFMAKIIFFGAMFYLLARLDIVNMVVFTISFEIFFTIFLNVEIFMIYKRSLSK